jgi:hypothetical protein
MRKAGTRKNGKITLEMDSQWSERKRLKATHATVMMDAAKVASDELTA